GQADDDPALRDAAAQRPLRSRVDVRGRRHGRGRYLRTALTIARGPEGGPCREVTVGTTPAEQTPAAAPVRGGSWLLDESPADDIFTPEQLTDEHRLMAQTTDEFVDGEVLPALDRLEQKDWDLARALLRRAGELGLLAIAVPEEHGGLDLDKVSSLVVVE